MNERETMDEKEGVLSAEELVHMLDKGKARLEAEGMGGVELRKVLEWTGAPWEKEEVSRRLDCWNQSLSGHRAESRASLSQGTWDPDKQRAVLDRWHGRQFEFMGTQVDGRMELRPEEALYLIEYSPQLELLYGGVPVSVEQGYSALLGRDCTLEEYFVYAKLTKLGYKVIRHQGDLGITEYEKRLGLDQYFKKYKNNKNCGIPLEGTCILTGNGVVAPVWLQEIRERENPAIYDHYYREDTYAPAYKGTEAFRIVEQLMEEILDQIHKDHNPFIKEEPSNTPGDRKRKLSDSAHESSGESRSKARKKKKKRKGNSKQSEELVASSTELCYRCVKNHPGGADRCYALQRSCTQCRAIGHYDKIHAVESTSVRDFILENLINPETQRTFDEQDLWPTHDTIDLPDDNVNGASDKDHYNDNEVEDDYITLSPVKMFRNPFYEGSTASDDDQIICDDEINPSCDLEASEHAQGNTNVLISDTIVLEPNISASTDTSGPNHKDTSLSNDKNTNESKNTNGCLNTNVSNKTVDDVIDILSDDEEAVKQKQTGSSLPADPVARADVIADAIIQVNQQELKDLSKTMDKELLSSNLPTGFYGDLVRCDVCKINCNSRDIMVEHLHGKKHKRRLACLSEPVRNAFLKKLRNLGLFKEGLGSSEGVEPASFTCSICMVESKSAVNHKAHLNGKPHLRKLQVVAEHSADRFNRKDSTGGKETITLPPGFQLVETLPPQQRRSKKKKPLVLKSKEALLDLVPNAHQQQKMIIKVMSDFIPESCQKAMKIDNQRFVTTQLSEADESSGATEFIQLNGDSSNGSQSANVTDERTSDATDRQRSLRRTSGAFDCDVCNIQLGSAAPYIAHLKSGRHLKKLNLTKQGWF